MPHAPCLCLGRANIRCDESHCDLAGPGAPGNANECRVCWLRLRKPLRVSQQPCRHLGEPTGATRPCLSCTGTVQVPLHQCAQHGTCSVDKLLAGVPCCRICPDREAVTVPRAQRIVRLDPARLHPSPHQFNCSIAFWDDRLLLAYRTHRRGSQLHLAELDPDSLQPVSTTPLFPEHELCQCGREDPRLFIHDGKLYLSLIGISEPNGASRTHQLYARLAGPPWHIAAVYYPDLAGRQPWREKNWSFFSHASDLLAVYRCHPQHEVVRITETTADRRHADTGLAWDHGEPRGGAPPVRVGDEYYHWFHGTTIDQRDADYVAGLYTFAAAPPFAVRRLIPTPLLAAPEMDVSGDWRKHVIFPCGAVRRDGEWLVSYGYGDTSCRIAVFRAADIEPALVPV